MAREGFVVYHELLKWLEPYGDAERGRLFTAMLKYSLTGEAPGLSGSERYIWPAVQDKIDKDREAYETKCKQLQANATRSKQMLPDATISAPTETETKLNQTETKPIVSTGEKAHARGEYGWVKLTDQQYSRLLEDLGEEELARCIRYIDESAQSSGNKNKWSDWNLVVRRCHREGWGLGPSRQNNSPNARPASGKSLTSEEQVKKYGAHSPAEIRALVDRI